VETKQQLETNLTNAKKDLENFREQRLAETDANKQQALDKNIEFKEKQVQSLRDKLAYWTEKGITSQESLNPNWTKERGITNRKTGNRTIDTKEQRNQQIGKVLQVFNNLEVDPPPLSLATLLLFLFTCKKKKRKSGGALKPVGSPPIAHRFFYIKNIYIYIFFI